MRRLGGLIHGLITSPHAIDRRVSFVKYPLITCAFLEREMETSHTCLRVRGEGGRRPATAVNERKVARLKRISSIEANTCDESTLSV